MQVWQLYVVPTSIWKSNLKAVYVFLDKLSSSESSSETSTVEMFLEGEAQSQDSVSADMDIEFYKSDHNIPSRFLPLPEEESLSENCKEESDSHISKCSTDESAEVVYEDNENTIEPYQRKKMGFIIFRY